VIGQTVYLLPIRFLLSAFKILKINLMVTVYLENKNHSYSEIIATFPTEQVYMYFLPKLEELANELDMIITESIDETI
jgi:hypothetical protein